MHIPYILREKGKKGEEKKDENVYIEKDMQFDRSKLVNVKICA